MLLNRIGEPGIDPDGVHLRLSRLQLLHAKFGSCYVAQTEDGSPCYMQWLFGVKDNAQLQRYFSGMFPILKPGEALLEGAYTLEKVRGLGVMAAAMAQIAEKAGDVRGRHAIITFVRRGKHRFAEGLQTIRLFRLSGA